jgi:hypothetical protein
VTTPHNQDQTRSHDPDTRSHEASNSSTHDTHNTRKTHNTARLHQANTVTHSANVHVKAETSRLNQGKTGPVGVKKVVPV